MIPRRTNTIVEENWDLPEQSFTIDSNNARLIIELLRNSIYVDPLTSAFKEVFSNALDEHIKLNIARPIEIQMPSRFNNNELSIRDFGLGMSLQFMSTDYTAVGHSTKSKDTALLGGYGIGRMSPLAYSNMYVVTSITKDDDCITRKREYIVSAKNGNVYNSLLHTEETSEPTGVCVSFSIKEQDVSRIQETVKELTRHIDVLIDGELKTKLSYDIEYKSVKYVRVENTRNYSNNITVHCLVNNIPNVTTLSKMQIGSRINDNFQLTRLASLCFRGYLYTDIDVNSVDLAADKSIQLSNRSIDVICEALTRCFNDFTEYFNLEINKADTIIEVLRLVHKMGYDTYDVNNSKFTWKNLPLTIDFGEFSEFRTKITKKGSHLTRYKTRFYDQISYVLGKTHVIVDDHPNPVPTKQLNEALANHGILLEKGRTVLIENTTILDCVNNQRYSIAEFYGLPKLSDYIPLSTRPKDSTVVSPSSTRKLSTNDKVRYLSHVSQQLGRLLLASRMQEEEAYYITEEFYEKHIHKSNILRDLLIEYFGRDQVIVTNPDFVSSKWTNALDYIWEKEGTHFDSNALNHIDRNYLINNTHVYRFSKKYPQHLITQIVQLYEKNVLARQNFVLINKLLLETNYKECPKASIDYNDAVALLHSTYPILKTIDKEYYGVRPIYQSEGLYEYIELIDKRNGYLPYLKETNNND